MVSILRQVQDQVASQLSSSAQLSACQILVEDSRDIDFEIKNALGRQGLVLVVTTPKATFAGKLEDYSLAWQLDQLEIDCIENVTVNRGQKDGVYMTAQEAAMSVFDVLCPLEGSREGQIHPVSYEQGQDRGLLVSRCILKCLVTGESSGPGPGPEPISMVFVKLLGEEPPEGVLRKDGWMWPAADGFVMWQDGEAHTLGVSMDQVSAYVDSRLSNYLPAVNVGNYSNVDRFLQVASPAAYDDIPVLVVAKNKGTESQRVLELIASTPPSYDGWGLTMGFDGEGKPQFKFGSDDYFYEGGHVIKLPKKDGVVALEQDLSSYLPLSSVGSAVSAKADLSALDGYLPLSGGQMSGDIDMGGSYEQDEDSHFLKFIDRYLGNGIMGDGFGVYKADGDGELKTQYVLEGVQLSDDGSEHDVMRRMDIVPLAGRLSEAESQISGKADLSALGGYLPLSGGNVDGYLSVGNNVVLEHDLGGGVVRLSDGNGNWTYLQGNRISNNGSNFYFPLPPYPDDYTLATQEWTTQTALSSYMKATAMTQAEYDQITPDPTTLYVITES